MFPLDILDILRFMKKRTTRTYTIDDELYKLFDQIIKEKNINKSRLIESFIRDFVNENNKKL
jgi:metal-responsive CopG/Arc/MetJ family transcriptional regulator